MRGFIVGTVVTAVAFWILAVVLPSYTSFDLVTYTGDPIGLIVVALVFGVVNGLIGPIVRLLALPIRLATLGLIGFVINAGLLLLTAWIADLLNVTLKIGDFPPNLLSINTFVAAIVGAIILSVISSLIGMFVKD
jgi:putative membrane protein